MKPDSRKDASAGYHRNAAAPGPKNDGVGKAFTAQRAFSDAARPSLCTRPSDDPNASSNVSVSKVKD